jgi:hypothetical protein
MDPQNQTPISNSPSPQVEEKSVGPAIGIIVIILIIIIGGLYFWGERVSNDVPAENNNVTENSGTDTNIQSLESQGTGDDVDSIEADLNSTDLNQLGSEINSVEAEAEAESTTGY